MKSSLVLVICTELLVVTHGFPADENVSAAKVGLNPPSSTETTPHASECGLDEVSTKVYGDSAHTNCGLGSPLPPIPDLNGRRNTTPPLEKAAPDQPLSNPQSQPFDPSILSEGSGCVCVPYYLCRDYSTMMAENEGLIDIGINEEECDHYLKWCCKRGSIIPTNDSMITTSKPKPTDGPKCGKRNSEGIGFRITGDNDNVAQYAELPWMVALMQRDQIADGKTASVYRCGGSLIHPRVVLTAAHCVQGKDNLVIRAGEWDTQTKNELYPTQDRNVKTVITHEQFHNGSLANDPALLILESPVDMTVENVGLLCLPEANENMDNRDCVASGWGKDQFGKEGKYQVILKRVEVPTVPTDPCQEALRKTRLGPDFKLDTTFICAGGQPGKDTCKGDGGSPLACPRKDNPNVYVQAGIVAWGIDCGTETPAVYVNVPFFVNWINNKLKAEGISMD